MNIHSQQRVTLIMKDIILFGTKVVQNCSAVDEKVTNELFRKYRLGFGQTQRFFG